VSRVCFGRKCAKKVFEPGVVPELANTTVVPDDHFSCFDVMYYTGVRDPFEWFRQSPVWELVGTNVHFSKRMEDLADGYLRKVLGVEDAVEVPPFIPVHIRRTDFAGSCHDIPVKDCLAPLSAYARRIKQAHEEIVKRHGPDSILATASQRVVVSSDEDDPAWWEQVRAMGWLYIDHAKEGTASTYGPWYPTIIDAVIQSRGAAMVGTVSSTMSMVSARRVRDWNGGPSKMVFTGSKGADDAHPRRFHLESEWDVDWE